MHARRRLFLALLLKGLGTIHARYPFLTLRLDRHLALELPDVDPTQREVVGGDVRLRFPIYDRADGVDVEVAHLLDLTEDLDRLGR